MEIQEYVGADKMISYSFLKQSEQVGVIGTSFAQWLLGQGKSPRGPPSASKRETNPRLLYGELKMSFS